MSAKTLQKSARIRFLDAVTALVWACAWLVLTTTVATPAASVAAFFLAIVGFFVGRTLAYSNIRTPSLVVGAVLATPILYKLSVLPSQSPLLAGLFPSAKSLVVVTDLMSWGLLAGSLVLLLQFLSNRHQWFVSLEVLIVALFMATPFAAHRDGFINRPHFLIDPLWSRGYDPVPVLQALGFVVALVLILLTVGRATKRSSLFDVVLLSVLALVLYTYIPQKAIKDFVKDPPGNSGLTGKPVEAKPITGGAGTGQEPLSGSSGNSENPFPFESQSKPDKPKPVAAVIFRDDYDPPDGHYYFRQTAFSQYNGFRLVKDTTNAADKDLFKHFPTRTETIEGPPKRFDIPTKKLETRVALISSHTEPFGLTSPHEMKPAPNPNPEHFERAYDLESLVYIGDYSEIMASSLESPAWTPEVKQHYLGYPAKDPRYKALADQIIGDIPPDYRDFAVARALAITLYLGEKGKYTIRKRPVQGSDDPTADFLFGDMTGYCVHFSHAAVYLMRAAGIPARVGAGYAVESRDKRGSALMILGSRAHAWPEIWVDGLGWYPFDVAPQTNLDPPGQPVDYDLQAMLAEMAREEGDTFEQPPEFNLRDMIKRLFALFFNFLPWLIAAGLVAAYGLKILRRVEPRFEEGDERVHALYKAALDKAGEAGFRREYGQGRMSFCESYVKEIPSLAPLTKAHLALTMGREGSADYDLQELSESYSKLGQEIAASVPLWRRLVGMLNPLSWLYTR